VNVGSLMFHSPELGRQRGDRAMAVRATAVGSPVRSVLRLRDWEMGGGDECGEKGRAPHPFIGSEGERGGRVSEGNGRRRWCAIME
jgi:hypothetical protein